MDTINVLDILGQPSSINLTPDIIISKIIHIEIQASFFHWNTVNYEHHKFLDVLKDTFDEIKDEIAEILLGEIGPTNGEFPIRFGEYHTYPINMQPSIEYIRQFISETRQFLIQLYNYSNDNNYLQLANITAELEGKVAKVKYLETLI